nr:MAG TPA: hypothetical protein [Caudoviricetes sp.]
MPPWPSAKLTSQFSRVWPVSFLAVLFYSRTNKSVAPTEVADTNSPIDLSAIYFSLLTFLSYNFLQNIYTS